MLTRVILEGGFAKAVGQSEWFLDCNSPGEALRLIEANKPGIRAWISKNLRQYQICEVEVENENGTNEKLDTEGFLLNRKCKTIRFLPIFTGAGGRNGVLQTIVGAVMVVVGAIVSYWSGPIGAEIMKMGVGLMLGGVISMIMSPSANNDDDDGGNNNYYFNGAVNTTQQGQPVPLIFGRCRVGSAVISSTIEVAEANG